MADHSRLEARLGLGNVWWPPLAGMAMAAFGFGLYNLGQNANSSEGIAPTALALFFATDLSYCVAALLFALLQARLIVAWRHATEPGRHVWTALTLWSLLVGIPLCVFWGLLIAESAGPAFLLASPAIALVALGFASLQALVASRRRGPAATN